MRKIVSLVLLAFIMFPVLGDAARSNSAIKEQRHLNAYEQKGAANVEKKTSLTSKEVSRYMDMGMSEEDILSCYVIWQFVDKSLDDVVQTYLDENKDLDMTLKDYEIERADYDEKYMALMETNEDPVRRNNVPWLHAPIK